MEECKLIHAQNYENIPAHALLKLGVQPDGGTMNHVARPRACPIGSPLFGNQHDAINTPILF